MNMFFNRFHKKKWDDAYYASPHFYKKNGEILGVFALTENTDTVLTCKPYAEIENKEVNRWEILLVPLGNIPPIGSVDFEKVIKILKRHQNVEQDDDKIYITGLSKTVMQEIYNKALLL